MLLPFILCTESIHATLTSKFINPSNKIFRLAFEVNRGKRRRRFFVD